MILPFFSFYIMIMISCIYFLIYCTMSYFYPQHLFVVNWCVLLFHGYWITNSFCAIYNSSLLCIISSYKGVFKRKTCVIICIASQWIGELLVSLPFVLRSGPVSCFDWIFTRWRRCCCIVLRGFICGATENTQLK